MKWITRVFKLSLEGVSPETLALSVGLAIVLGVFPIYGCPTLLCAAAAILLRLNLPAMQLVNVLTSPLQLVLFIPFHRFGGWLLSAFHPLSAPAPVCPHALQWVAAIWILAEHAIAGWFCICAPLCIVLCLTKILIARKLTKTPCVTQRSQCLLWM
jgi:uncharacterized protein (DUF2062 family)